MKNNFKLLSGSIILFTVSVLYLFSAPAWSCPPPPPVAILEISPDPAVEGETVLLDGSKSTASCGYINLYVWDFTNNNSYDYYETPTYYPDGAFDGKTTYTYTNAGTYTAKLFVGNSCNDSDTDTDTVVVKKPNVVSYTYDGAGNRTSMTDSSGATSYSYDYLGRLISVANPDDKIINYQYDANGNRVQLTDPNGNVTAYAYNGNSRLTQVDAPAGLTTYQYDSLGNLTRADLPNGTYTQYTYNSQRNWLVSMANKEPNDAVLSSYSYTYDNVGNRLSVTEADSSVVSYDYDDIYQLTGETRTGANAYSITYQYDDAGNRTQMVKNSVATSYTYNNNNQLLTETTGGTTTTYAYDGNGNLLSKTAGGSTTTYTWDWNNHLLAVSASGSSTAYAYDGDDNRISKTANGVKTKYVNDIALSLVQVLQETDNAGIIQADYTYGQGLICMNKAGVNSYYHYDGLGSIRQLTNSSGAAVANYTYDSYGNLIASTGTSNNTYGFTGQQQFGEADNLVFLRTRYYEPGIGRFLSFDTMKYIDGLNLYIYARNNPVARIDPTGTSWKNWVGIIPIIGTGVNCYSAIAGSAPGANANDYSDCFPKCPNPDDSQVAVCMRCVAGKSIGYQAGNAAGGYIRGIGETLIGLFVPGPIGWIAIGDGAVDTVCGFANARGIYKGGKQAQDRCKGGDGPVAQPIRAL